MKPTTKKAAPAVSTKTPPLTPLLISRFCQVVATTKPPLMVQAVEKDTGRLLTLKAERNIYSAVLGKRSGEAGELKTLGIRKLAQVYFIARLLDDTIVGVDIVPERMFVRGTAPTLAKDAITKGFSLVWSDSLAGFDLSSPEDKDGVSRRIVCIGMTHGSYHDILDAVRADPKAKRLLVGRYHVQQTEPGTYRVKPVAAETTEGGDYDVTDVRRR